MLEILRHAYVRDGHAIGQIIEYAGPVVERLSVDERATMTNMAAEVGAFTGLVAADDRTVEFLIAERGMDPAWAKAMVADVHSDPGAEYVKVIEIDASRLRPMVALPGDPGNGLYIDELAEPVPIEIAYAGSCTAGKKGGHGHVRPGLPRGARAVGARGPPGCEVLHPVRLDRPCGSTRASRATWIFSARWAPSSSSRGAARASPPGRGSPGRRSRCRCRPRTGTSRAARGRASCTWYRRIRWPRSAVAGRVVGWEPGVGVERVEEAPPRVVPVLA